MKPSRSFFLSVFIIGFLIAAVVLGMKYKSATTDHKLAQKNLVAERVSLAALNQEKADLNTSLAQAVADIAAWNNKIALLQTALEQANLSLKQTQSKFPASVQTIEYNETLLGLARSSNLMMRTLVASEPSEGELTTKDFTFYTNVFTVVLDGKVSDILDFLNKVATNVLFKTGAITPVGFSIPQPLSQAEKDQMRADIKGQMVAEKSASITGRARVALIEQALLELLGESSAGPTVEEMTQAIKDVITRQFSPDVADLLAGAITQAIEEEMAGRLIDIVAEIYSKAIAALFTGDDIAGLLPVFNGPLGAKITEVIQGIPVSAIPTAVKKVISDTLNSMVAAKISAMVSDASVNAALAEEVTAAEMPSAQLTVAVYSYK